MWSSSCSESFSQLSPPIVLPLTLVTYPGEGVIPPECSPSSWEEVDTYHPPGSRLKHPPACIPGPALLDTTSLGPQLLFCALGQESLPTENVTFPLPVPPWGAGSVWRQF